MIASTFSPLCNVFCPPEESKAGTHTNPFAVAIECMPLKNEEEIVSYLQTFRRSHTQQLTCFFDYPY